MWILPTYRRPKRLQETLISLTKCSAGQSGIVIIDGECSMYKDVALPVGWKMIKKKDNRGYIHSIKLALRLYPDEPWYGWMTDDMIAETAGFEERLLENMSDDTLISSSNDGWQAPSRIHGATIFDGGLYRLVMENFPPIRHSYYDDIWEDIGNSFGIWKTDMDVMVRHNHPWKDKTIDLDSSYKKSYSFLQEDSAVYSDYKSNTRNLMFQKIRRYLDGRS